MQILIRIKRIKKRPEKDQYDNRVFEERSVPNEDIFHMKE